MKPTLPLTPYLSDLLDQPCALRATVHALRAQRLPEQITARLSSSRTIVLTGMGASFFAFYPLQQALLRRLYPVQLLETSELLYSFDNLLRPEALVIAASQSGRSAEILTLLARKTAGFEVLGISNTPDSPLAQQADARVLTDAGAEMTVSCKTYLAMLTALTWLEHALLEESPERALDEIEASLPAMEAYLAGWQAHVDDLIERLRPMRELFVVGRGRSLAAAWTGGLIVKESTHLHSEGMSSAAFRHGPLEMTGPDVFVVVMEGSGAVVDLNRRLYEDVLKYGGMAGWVSEQSEEAVFRLPAVPETARPLFEILPVQMMTLAIAALRGHEAGRFTISGKVTESE